MVAVELAVLEGDGQVPAPGIDRKATAIVVVSRAVLEDDRLQRAALMPHARVQLLGLAAAAGLDLRNLLAFEEDAKEAARLTSTPHLGQVPDVLEKMVLTKEQLVQELIDIPCAQRSSEQASLGVWTQLRRTWR